MIDLRCGDKELRAHMAENHYKYITKHHGREIKECVNNTIRYTGGAPSGVVVREKYGTMITVYDSDSVSCLFKGVTNGGACTAVLNFASFKHPGGMFLNGSPAQEEALCHHSILYPVLLEFKRDFYEPHVKEMNKGLYTDDILYTKDVLFFDCKINSAVRTKQQIESGETFVYTYDKQMLADVLTVAAPNAGAYYRRFENGNHDAEAVEAVRVAMESRIDALLYVAYCNEVKNLILGAFGCGVFKNDPYMTAKIFRQLLKGKYDGVFENVFFPIPGANFGMGKSDYNLEIFAREFIDNH